ncbi:MAG: hypothetical protein IJ764_04800 [Bacteroidales bacterium]|nr:hypothetical protein [Bacteroidales bacterium]
MKKTFLKVAAVAVMAAMTLTSCAVMNSGAAISSNSPVGTKVGEAKSGIVFALFSLNGKENNIQKAAANGGITKISHVEYIDNYILGGIYIEHTTRVYGE